VVPFYDEHAIRLDTAKLDEIDAMVWCWLRGDNFIRVTDDGMVSFCTMGLLGSTINEADFPSYSRSRDALKAIRPEGWKFKTEYFAGQFHTVPFLRNPFALPYSPLLPSEELAELHAIIQALEYERRDQSAKA
jgi:hypothetical protein